MFLTEKAKYREESFSSALRGVVLGWWPVAKWPHGNDSQKDRSFLSTDFIPFRLLSSLHSNLNAEIDPVSY